MIQKNLDSKKEFNIYSGINSFDDDALENELSLIEELGFDSAKLRKYGYNPLQLSEIRKGLADKLDVRKYLNPKMSWLEMEEIRLELYQGIDMSPYRKEGFDVQQIFQIRKGLNSNIDVSVFAKKDYLAEQMREIRKGLVNSSDFPIIFYMDPAFDHLQMREIRKGLEKNIDVSMYAYVDMPYMKMRVIRESAEDGLVFDQKKINTYNYGILDQLHKAFVDNIDISKYVEKRFDAEQLEQISICLNHDIKIDKYISVDMRSDAIREIRLGIESGVNVEQYADASYNWQQMQELRLGLEHQIDITPYAKPLYWANQMHEIRLGLEDGIDVSMYSSLMYTAKDMHRIRERIVSGEYLSDITFDDVDDGDISSKEESIIDFMTSNKNMFLSLTKNNMICHFTLPPKVNKEIYTAQVIVKFLHKAGIRKGVDPSVIAQIVKGPIPGHEYLIAAGKEPVDGTDGYYEYFFDTEKTSSLEENDSGDVDFSTIDSIVRVNVGDILAKYHKATAGTDGYDVYGKAFISKKGKEKPIIKGEGFMIMNDRVSYVAKYTGALSYIDGELFVQKIKIHNEVKVSDKTIRYDGTILVTGDVLSGSEIHATGDIIISGHMESAFLYSGGNIIIKGGSTCPIRGGIEAKGNVIGKYFEGLTIKAKNIIANSFVNCTLFATEYIKALGKDGVVYGGTIQAEFGFESNNVGSKAGSRTIVSLGVVGNLLFEYNTLKNDINREAEELKTLTKERDRLLEVGAINRELMQWKIRINAAVGMKEHSIKELQDKKALMEDTISKGMHAKAIIKNYLYQGVIFVICGVTYKVDSQRSGKLSIGVDANRENIVIL